MPLSNLSGFAWTNLLDRADAPRAKLYRRRGGERGKINPKDWQYFRPTSLIHPLRYDNGSREILLRDRDSDQRGRRRRKASVKFFVRIDSPPFSAS